MSSLQNSSFSQQNQTVYSVGLASSQFIIVSAAFHRLGGNLLTSKISRICFILFCFTSMHWFIRFPFPICMVLWSLPEMAQSWSLVFRRLFTSIISLSVYLYVWALYFGCSLVVICYVDYLLILMNRISFWNTSPHIHNVDWIFLI